jgi:hypothetical protein
MFNNKCIFVADEKAELYKPTGDGSSVYRLPVIGGALLALYYPGFSSTCMLLNKS